MDDSRKQPQLSIIVPVYNVMRFLRECLDSIASQTFSDWEAILVDDGSTDGSGAVCDEYAARDPRFRVIHKANGGQSSARNMALDVARGEYIGFVDSDDFIKPEMYAVLVGNACKYNADIAVCGFINLYVDHTGTDYQITELEVAGRDRALEILGCSFDSDVVWNKIYRREIFTIRFPMGKLFEDTRIIAHIFDKASTVVFDPDMLYYYRMRAGSTMNSLPMKQYFSRLEANDEKYSVYRKYGDRLGTEWRAQHLRMIMSILRMAIRELPDDPGIPDLVRKANETVRFFTFRDVRKLKLKNQARFLVLRYFPGVYPSLLSMQNENIRKRNRLRMEGRF